MECEKVSSRRRTHRGMTWSSPSTTISGLWISAYFFVADARGCVTEAKSENNRFYLTKFPPELPVITNRRATIQDKGTIALFALDAIENELEDSLSRLRSNQNRHQQDYVQISSKSN
eukprot:scaffold16220_cov51-Attheya_sp.AAC.6